MKRTVLAPLAFVLAGCLGPAYQTPPVTVPQHWPESVVRMHEDHGPASDWWSSFGDATLDELVRDAVANNYDLQAAAARVRTARALRGMAASRGKAQVGGSAIAAETQRSDAIAPTGGDRRQQLYDLGFDAGWEIDLFGGVRRDVEAAAAQVEATDAERSDVQVTLLAEVARNYVELRGAQRRLDVLDARIETLRDTLDIVRTRRQAGLTTELDVARSEALLEETSAARPALEYFAIAAIHRLAVLTGRQPDALQDRLTRHAPIPRVPSEVTAGVPADLVAHRPDVRRAERELAAATARIDVARADLYPRISLAGTLGHRSDDAGDLVSAASRYFAFGPVLQWPLLTGGRVRSQIEAQRGRRDQAEAAFRQSVLRALEEVEDALATCSRDEHERQRLAAAVDAERRAVDLAGARYRGGLDSFLTVLDAQRTLRDGEDRLAAVETRAALSSIALYKALGGA